MNDKNESPEKILTEVLDFLCARVSFDGLLYQGIDHTPWGDYEHMQFNCRCNQQIGGPKNENQK